VAPSAPSRLGGHPTDDEPGQDTYVAEYIYTLRKARKAHGDKVVLDDVTLSFLPGAKIGEHVTIGANSVVTGEIPSFSVAVGSPAKVIRRYVEGEGWVRT